MATRDRTDPQKGRAAQATVQDNLAVPGASNIGASPLTGVPGSGAAQDNVRPLGAGAAAPQAADDESVRDDTAQASTRARFQAPSWLVILWQNRKARVGLIILACFVLVALLAPVLAPYDPHSTAFLPSQQPT